MRKLALLFLLILVFSPAFSGAVERADIKGHSSGGITLNLSEPAGSIYQPGENVRFSFSTTNDAYVIIFDLDTDGYVHLLYPESGILSTRAAAGKKYVLPDYGDPGFIVTGSTGMELVFALAVPKKESINEEELSFLADNDKVPDAKKFRIDGDPLLAANMIAGELVRDISYLKGVSLAYTYFYVNERVAYPRYVCAQCHEKETEPYKQLCQAYDFNPNLEETDHLSYPLERGFEVVRLSDKGTSEQLSSEEDIEEPDTEININFYPYDSYVYPRASSFYYAYDPWYWSPLWYDPWGYWNPFYPTYSGFGFYFGWGWNWGSWGWDYWSPHHYRWRPHYYPFYFSHYDRYRHFLYRPYRPSRYRYKNPLYTAASINARRDPNLRIGSVLRNDLTESTRYKTQKSRSPRQVIESRNKYDSGNKYRSYIKRDKSHMYNSGRITDKSRTYMRNRETRINPKSGTRIYKPSNRSIEPRTYIRRQVEPQSNSSKRTYKSRSTRTSPSPTVKSRSSVEKSGDSSKSNRVIDRNSHWSSHRSQRPQPAQNRSGGSSSSPRPSKNRRPAKK